MARACRYSAYAASGLVEDQLANLGKQVIGAALDSYIPGASAVLGIGGGDPFAAQADRIVDAIEAPEQNIRDEIQFPALTMSESPRENHEEI